MFAFAGAVPIPESLLLSPPPLVPLEPTFTASLLSSVSPSRLEELRRTCKGNTPCIHDTIASGSSELGLHTLAARQKFEELALIYGETWENSLCFLLFEYIHPNRSDCHLPGNMPPVVTEPAVIHCKVNSTVNTQFFAQDLNGDRITYSLLYPRPSGASINSGEASIFIPLKLNRREPPILHR